MSIVTTDGKYLHRMIHRLGSLTGDVVDTTPWTEGRFRMGEDGFVECWISHEEYTGWGPLHGAHMDNLGRYIRTENQFAPLPAVESGRG